jgi:hypothetical protein
MRGGAMGEWADIFMKSAANHTDHWRGMQQPIRCFSELYFAITLNLDSGDCRPDSQGHLRKHLGLPVDWMKL